MMSHSNSPTGQAKAEDADNSSSQSPDYSSEADLGNDENSVTSLARAIVDNGRQLQNQQVRQLQNEHLSTRQRSAMMLSIQRTLGNRYAQNLMRSMHDTASGSIQRSNTDGKIPNLDEPKQTDEKQKKPTQPQIPVNIPVQTPVPQPTISVVTTSSSSATPSLIQTWLNTNPFEKATTPEIRSQIMASKKSQLESDRLKVKGGNALERRQPYTQAIEWLGTQINELAPQKPQVKANKEKPEKAEASDPMAHLRKFEEQRKAQAAQEEKKRQQKKAQKERNTAENEKRRQEAEKQRLLEFKNLRAELPKIVIAFKKAIVPEDLDGLVAPLQTLKERAKEFAEKEIELEVSSLLEQIPVRQQELIEQKRREEERLHQEYLNLMRLEEQKIQPGMVNDARNIVDSAATEAAKEVKKIHNDFKRPEGKAGLALGSYVSQRNKQRFYVAAINDMPASDNEAYALWLEKLQPLLLNACEKQNYKVVHAGVFGKEEDVHEEVSLRNWLKGNAVDDVMPGTRIIMAVNHNTICGSCVIRLSNLEANAKSFNIESLPDQTLAKLKTQANTKLHIASDMANSSEYKNFKELDVEKKRVQASYKGIDVKGNTASSLTFNIEGSRNKQVEANLASYSTLY